MNSIILGDGLCCLLYDLQTKCQLPEWKLKSSPQIQKFCLDKRKGKVMLNFFFICKVLSTMNWICKTKQVNKEMCIDILCRMQDTNQKKNPLKWKWNSSSFARHCTSTSIHPGQRIPCMAQCNISRSATILSWLGICQFLLISLLENNSERKTIQVWRWCYCQSNKQLK